MKYWEFFLDHIWEKSSINLNRINEKHFINSNHFILQFLKGVYLLDFDVLLSFFLSDCLAVLPMLCCFKINNLDRIGVIYINN